jgi:hypothetical protein
MKKLFDIDVCFMRFANIYNKIGNYYVSIKRLPKLKGNEEFKISREYYTGEGIAIVMQGPLLDDFTINTVCFYRRIFPGAEIIVSTWDDSPLKYVNALKKAGAIVIISHLPENMGCSHINAQLGSTRPGIKKALEDGADYVLKVRTDWRIYYPGALGYLRALSEGLTNDNSGKMVVIDNSNNRTFELPPFFVSDFLYFGRSEDMKILSEIPDSDIPYKDAQDYAEKNGLNYYPSFEEQCKHNLPPEYYIFTNYLKKKGECGPFNDWEYYRKCAKKYFVSISQYDIDAYWPKYKSSIVQPTSWVDEGRRQKYKSTCKGAFADYLNFIQFIGEEQY